jgi:hypothetical protein
MSAFRETGSHTTKHFLLQLIQPVRALSDFCPACALEQGSAAQQQFRFSLFRLLTQEWR